MMSLSLSSSAIIVAQQPEPAVLISIFKPIVLFFIFVGWGHVVTFLDKDAQALFLQRRLWNGIHVAAAALAALIWLMLGFFWLGLPLAVIIVISTIMGYGMYRNTKVPEDLHWGLTLGSFKQKIGDIEQNRAQQQASVHLLTRQGDPIAVPLGDDPYAQAHIAIEQLVDFAMPRGGNRIEIVTDASKSAIDVRIDGVPYPQPAMEPRMAMAVIDYVKQHAGMDVEDRRRRQRGTLMINVGDYGQHEFSVTSAGSTRSQNMVIEIDREKATLMSLVKLGLLESQRNQIEPLFDENKRVVIASCPAHQGMATTLNSLISRHDPYTQSIMTLEEKVEIELEGVTHEKIETGTDAEAIERRLLAILRSDPSVIMLGMLSNVTHARLIADAAANVRFYLGLRREDTFSALKVWIKAVGDNELAAQSLGAMVTQRLVRKLCPTCRVAYKPDPTILRKLNLPSDRIPQLYKHSGQVRVGRDRTENCPSCLGMGYRGRIGVFETMVLDDKARQILASGQFDQFRAYLRRSKMLYLQESALFKAVEGLTSINEITRVLGGESAVQTAKLP